MNYITVKEAAERWGISTRRVQILCSQGRIEGITHFGRSIMIPENTVYPVGNELQKETEAITLEFPRKTPFLYMTDLYSDVGYADKCCEHLQYNPEAQMLFAAEIAYARGEIDKVYESASYLLNQHSGFYQVLSAGMLLALCAIWRGDLDMWRRAKIHISEAPARNDNDRDIISLAITAVDSMLYDTTAFPDWFRIGNFEPIPEDALPAVKVYYGKYLYATAYAVATKELELEGVHGLSFMSMVPLAIEPMISQAKADRSIVAEIYLRLTCAAVYYNTGDKMQAIRHIDRAIELAIPDKLYGILVQYCRTLDALLDERLNVIDTEAGMAVRELNKRYSRGWSTLFGAIRGRHLVTTLSKKEREVAKLAAFGMSNAEIADTLNMSLTGVKQAIRIVSEKSGMDRKHFAAIL